MPAPPISSQLMLEAQGLVRPLLGNPRLYYPLIDTYRWLTQQVGATVGSSSGEELAGTTMPPRFLQRMGYFQRGTQ